MTRSLPYIVSPRMIIRLPYAELLNRTPGTATDEYQFNLNSLFDPNRTGTGHQPLGFDQWATFYNRYRVLGVDVRATFATTSTVPLRVGITASNSATNLTYLSSEELPNTRHAVISGSTGGPAVRELNMYVPLHVLNGRTLAEYKGSQNTEAMFSASPTEILILHTYASSYDGSNVAYSADIRLIFRTELFDRTELTES